MVAPLVSDVRVADSEMCAIPAWKYVSLEAATAPEVDGPIIPMTLLSATYFCASACAGAGPCSTGVSPVISWTFSPNVFGSVFIAYLAQLSCSLPRKPAPPVSGVTSASFILLLQLIACAAVADVVAVGRANAAVAAASASAAAASGSMSL